MTVPGHRHPHPPSPAGPAGLPAEAGAALAAAAPDGRLGHREHIHLAFIAVHRYGPQAAPAVVAGWLRRMAAYARAPQKFNATMTRAWTELVAHHLATAPQPDFAVFAERNPELLDKRLLSRHYTARTLASAAARAGWAEPDLAPFPWQATTPPTDDARPGPVAGHTR